MKSKNNFIPDSGWKCCRIGHRTFINGFKKEVTAHYNFIKKHDMVDAIYKYTSNSEDVRENDPYVFYFLKYLLENAPRLEKAYTVYRMGPPYSAISLYSKNGEYIKDTKISKLDVGNIFTEKRAWIEKNTSVISATYDRSYPLGDFTIGLDNKDVISLANVKQYLKLLRKDTFFHNYFDSAKAYEKYKSFVQELYEQTLSEVKKWINENSDNYKTPAVMLEELKNIIKYAKTASELNGAIHKEHFNSKRVRLIPCCFFKIKLKNKRGLFVERISKYPQQREILIPNGTKFRVTGISVENYGIINTSNLIDQPDDDGFQLTGRTEDFYPTFDNLHQLEGYQLNGDSKFPRFKDIPLSYPVKTKKVKVYEIEAFD